MPTTPMSWAADAGLGGAGGSAGKPGVRHTSVSVIVPDDTRRSAPGWECRESEIIGFIVLSLVFLLGLLTVGSAIHDFIRSRSLKYDWYWYDETGRWNRRQRNRQKPSGTGGESDKADAP